MPLTTKIKFMKRMIYVSLIAGYVILLLSNPGKVSAQSLTENKMDLTDIPDAGFNRSGLVSYTRGINESSEEAKQPLKYYSDL